MGKVSQQADTLLSFVLGPMERVRQFCLDCQGGQESFVTGCETVSQGYPPLLPVLRGGKGRSPLLWRRVPLRSVGVPLRRHAEDIRTR